MKSLFGSLTLTTVTYFCFLTASVHFGHARNTTARTTDIDGQMTPRFTRAASSKSIDVWKPHNKPQGSSSKHPFSHIPDNEVKIKSSYVFDANLRRGSISEGKVAAHYLDFGFIATPNLNEDFQFRTGFEIDRSSFSYNQSNTVPNTLQGTNLVIGFDWALYQDWLIRFEARPGIYTAGGNVTSKAFNTEFLLGASYFVNRDLSWLFGVTVNPWRDLPVIPGIGARWAFAKDWQLNLIFPAPRIEYRIAPGIKIYGGGEWKGGSYRTDNDFGDSHGDTSLNNAILDYREIRVGGGISAQPNNLVSLELETGAMLDRRYDYFRVDKEVRSGAAPYIQLGAAFRF